jgi:peptide/nickel transport system substrate-binding protein
MAQAGIALTVVREPNDGYWSDVWMTKPFCATYWGGRPTEDWMFATAYASGASWNETSWEHPSFNELLIAARSELVEALRREMYFEMQQLASDEGAIIVPMYASYVMATSNRVQTPETVAANWTMDGRRATERWWFG